MNGIAKTLLVAFVALGSALAWQRPWREYPGQDNIEIPPDYKVPAEWVFARLMYPPYRALTVAFGDFETGSRAGPVGRLTTLPPIGMSRLHSGV